MSKQKRDEIKKLVQQARDAAYDLYKNEMDAKKRTKLGNVMSSCDSAIKKLDEPDDSGYTRSATTPSPGV